MEPQLRPTRTVFTVSEYLEWQRSGALKLKPVFQRREVWQPKAKSLLIDTVVRGLSVPIVILRRRQNLETLRSFNEVVDGQQRLRTLFSYIDHKVLSDFDAAKDMFPILEAHNSNLAGKSFGDLPAQTRHAILDYEISTHVFSANTPDEVVLNIFARLNSTGAKLNGQELRNARFFGVFKTIAYDMAFRNLTLWRRWDLFDDNALARMQEVEAISEYLGVVVGGLAGKSQPALEKLYKAHDDSFERSELAVGRCQAVLDGIDTALGSELASTRFKRPVLFFSLFSTCYDHMYGLGTDYRKKRSPRSLPDGLASAVRKANKRILEGKVPEAVADAMEKATADIGRRKKRHAFFMEALGLEQAT